MESKEDRKKRKEDKKRKKEKEDRKSGDKKEKKRNSKEDKEKKRSSHKNKDHSLTKEIENHLARLDLRTSRERTTSDSHDRPNSLPVSAERLFLNGSGLVPAVPALVRRVLSQDHEPIISGPDSPRNR